MNRDDFSLRIIKWQRAQGRHHLPWQGSNPYHVWISEIMLQQTQVSTVIPYFLAFIHRFPSIRSLAAASLDTVYHLWSGLGYYRRAAHLHRAAILIVENHHGCLPDTLASLIELPGIGMSTAGAILSLGFKKSAVILDGNVKRVLCRHFLIQGYPEQALVKKKLWKQAQDLLPIQHIDHYNQGLMDLGASLCKKHQPLCAQCPINQTCQAHLTQCCDQIPASRPKKKIPWQQIQFLIYIDKKQIYMVKKTRSLWQGLWIFPIHATEDALPKPALILPEIKHKFTHRYWHIKPLIYFSKPDDANGQWFHRGALSSIGMPVPIKKIVTQLVALKQL